MTLFFRNLGLASMVLCLAVQAQPIVNLGIAAEGRIVPGEGLVTIAAPSQSGSAIVNDLKVVAGQAVEAGETIAILEGATRAETAIAVAQAQIDSANAGVDVAQQNLAVAEASVKAAEADVVTAMQRVREAEAAVENAKKAFSTAINSNNAASRELTGQIAEFQRILDELDPPRKETEELLSKQNILNLQIAKLADTANVLSEELLTKVDSAQTSVKTAEYQFKAAEAKVKILTEEKERARLALVQTKTKVAIAEATLKQVRAENEFYLVKAPMDATVIRINTQPGEAVGPEGVCYLGDTSNMFVEAQIYIDDITRVKVGQNATVESTIFEKPLNGQVAEIGLMVSQANLYLPDPTVFTDRRVVPVRIALDDDSLASKLIYAQVTVKISNGE